jgi:biopolymer transport protein ExbD
VNIKLPESSTAQKSDNASPLIVIYATKTQKVLIGEREVPLSQLAQALIAEKKPQTLFALKADTDVPLGFFVKVLDASKEAGLDNLSLFTEPSKDQAGR